MKQLYGIDMKQTQYGKTYEKIPAPDIAISMGVILAVRSLAESSIIIGACLSSNVSSRKRLSPVDFLSAKGFDKPFAAGKFENTEYQKTDR